jgi:hypothetical protein
MMIPGARRRSILAWGSEIPGAAIHVKAPALQVPRKVSQKATLGLLRPASDPLYDFMNGQWLTFLKSQSTLHYQSPEYLWME